MSWDINKKRTFLTCDLPIEFQSYITSLATNNSCLFDGLNRVTMEILIFLIASIMPE